MRLGWARARRVPFVVLAFGAPPCQETNPAFDPESTGTSAGDSSDGGSTSPVTMTTAATMTTDASAEGSTGPAPGDSTTSSPTDPTTGDPSADGSSGSSSGGGPSGDAYPPCMLDEDPPCPRPYDQCYDFLAPDFTVCSQTCSTDEDCPQPDGGTAEAVCAGPNDDQCVLDCGGGARCPAGMSCEMVGGGNVRRCAWPS